MRTLLIFVLMTLFIGCAKYVKTDVSVFHELSTPVTGFTYAIIPGSDQSESLEFHSYAALLKAELDKLGMAEMPESKAQYLIYMSYGTDNGRQVFSSHPVYGHTGIFGSFSTGSVVTRKNTATYTGLTLNTPLYGVVGTETHSELLFSRFLTIDIVDRTGGSMRKVYEAKALSIGDTAMLVTIIPAMIQSVFEDFPGQSGTTRSSRRALPEEK